MEEIATREGIDNSYVSRMVNLTTLAPDIAILDDALPDRVTLFDLAVNPATAVGRPARSAQVGAQGTMSGAIWTLTLHKSRPYGKGDYDQRMTASENFNWKCMSALLFGQGPLWAQGRQTELRHQLVRVTGATWILQSIARGG